MRDSIKKKIEREREPQWKVLSGTRQAIFPQVSVSESKSHYLVKPRGAKKIQSKVALLRTTRAHFLPQRFQSQPSLVTSLFCPPRLGR